MDDAFGPDVVAVDAVELVAAPVACCPSIFLLGAGLFGFGGSVTAFGPAEDVEADDVELVVDAVEPVTAFLLGAGLLGFGGSTTALGPVAVEDVEDDDEELVVDAVEPVTAFLLGAGLVGIGGSTTAFGPVVVDDVDADPAVDADVDVPAWGFGPS